MARKLKVNAQAIEDAPKEKLEEAWNAVKRFNELKGQLTKFARGITGNNKVEIHATSSGPYSTGNKIFLRPPLALGRNHVHRRQDCGRRGADRRQICEACRVREVVDFYLYHEIGHVWLGSEVRPNEGSFELLRAMIREWHPYDACSHADVLIRELNREVVSIGACNALSRYVGLIWNGLEDARVNEGMFLARPGLRTIFDVNIDRTINEGVETNTGEFSTWSEAPADSQFMVGLSMMACGHGDNLESWLHPAVAEALNDDRLVFICDRARNAGSPNEITTLAVEAFVVAQELGFCVVPKCEPVPESDDKPDDKDSENGQSEEQPPLTSDRPSPGGTGDDESQASTGEDSPGTPDANASGEPGRQDEQPKESPKGGSSDTGHDDDHPGNGDAESSTGPGDDTDDDEESDKSDDVDSGGNGREEDVPDGDGSGSEDGEPESGDSGGSIPDGDDDDPFQGQRPVSGESGSDDAPDSTDEELPDGVGGSADDPSKDGDGHDGDGPESDTGDTGTEDEGSDADNESGSEDDNDLASGEPENPWDIKSPEQKEHVGPVPNAGTIEDVEELLAPILMHGLGDNEGFLEVMLGEDMSGEIEDTEEDSPEFYNATPLVAAAIIQVAYFDDPSIHVAGIDIAEFPAPEIGWEPEDWESLKPSELLVGKAVLHARQVFQENARSKLERNHKSGKINTRVLAKRAPVGDPRLFGKKILPKKRDHLVIITGDCSASTHSYGRNSKIRRLMMAKGDVLHRTGVPFIMLGHSASNCKIKNFKTSRRDDYWTYILPIKLENEGWGPITKSRLAGMRPISENLDGHTLEYCRKLADRSQATDITIVYYTDGEMPASNYTEEREILEREIATCNRKGYHLLAVGIETDSPTQYGLDTVRVDSDDDIILVIQRLEQILTK